MLLARAARKKAIKEDVPIAENAVAKQPEPSKEQEQNAPLPASLEPETPKALLRRASAPSDGDRSQQGSSIDDAIGSQRISIEELRSLWQAREPVLILDVRTERSLEGVDNQASGAVRLPPDHVAERARELGLGKEAWLIAYCG
jgi:hypothetical protein